VLEPQATMPSAAQEIAQEAAAYLEGQVDRLATVAALSRAWKQALALALALARHDMKAHSGEEPTKG
jgi:hypothetical protein